MQSEHRVALIIVGVPSLKDAILSEVSGETARRFAEFSMGRIRPGSRGAATFGRNFVKSANFLGLQVAEEDALPDRILFAEHGQVGASVGLGKEILRAAISRQRDAITLDAAERVYRKSNVGLDMTPFDSAEWDVVNSELTSIGCLIGSCWEIGGVTCKAHPSFHRALSAFADFLPTKLFSGGKTPRPRAFRPGGRTKAAWRR